VPWASIAATLDEPIIIPTAPPAFCCLFVLVIVTKNWRIVSSLGAIIHIDSLHAILDVCWRMMMMKKMNCVFVGYVGKSVYHIYIERERERES
jgi:hypothetical protein